jgi:26S proteasome regulatory subunit N4
MSQIEKALHEHFAASKDQPSSSVSPNQNSSIGNIASSSSSTSRTEAGRPFAKVNSIVAGSPADQAGLKAGDDILLFGDVNWLNHEKLSKVAKTVQSHEGVS